MEASFVAVPKAALGVRSVSESCGGLPGAASGEVFVRCTSTGSDAIHLLTAYAKADREDLTPPDNKVLSHPVSAIKKGTKGS